MFQRREVNAAMAPLVQEVEACAAMDHHAEEEGVLAATAPPVRVVEDSVAMVLLVQVVEDNVAMAPLVQEVEAGAAMDHHVVVASQTSFLQKKLKLSSDVVIKKKRDKFLFLNQSIPDWVVTNVNGSIALKLCNGNYSIQEIADIVSNIARRDVRNEIISFLHRIDSTSKLFSSSTDYTSETYKLRTVQLSLTNQCNLKCIYCYTTARPISDTKLALTDYYNLIDAINNISKNAEIVFTGGEPLLSKHLFEIAEYAKKRGNDIQLLTNGLLINENNSRLIAEIFDLVKISVDGSTQKIHEKHRGENTFYKTLRNIDILFRNNAPLQISMTVTKENIRDIEGMTNKFGSALRFAPLFMVGRANNNKKLYVTGKEYYQALSSAEGVNPLGYLCSSLARSKKKKNMKCAIGDAEISISESGDVYPCQLLHLPQFLAGNIKLQSLESIYYQSTALKNCSNLNVLHVKGCKTCEIRFICGGACRARAFYEVNDINDSGKFCEYEKSAFINGLFEIHEFV